MAIVVPRDCIADERALAKALTVVEEQSYHPKQQRFAGKPKTNRVWVTSDDGQTISLPFAWAKSALGLEQRPDDDYVLYCPEPLEFRGELYEEQGVPAKQALAELTKTGCVILAMRTGFGKTVIGSWLAVRLPPFLILVVYSVNVCEHQWEEDFREFTNAKIWKTRKEKMPSDGFHVILASVGTMHKIPEAVRANVGILIVDEIHTFYTELRTRALLGVQPRYVIPMSATPEREDGRHLIVELLAGKTYVRVPGRKFNVRQIHTGFEPTYARDRDGTPLWNTLVDSLAGSALRNNIIADVVAKLVQEEHRKPLVLTSRVEHSTELGQLIAARLPGGERAVTVFRANMKTYEDAEVLVGTDKKLGTAFDEKAFVGDKAGFRRIDTVVITYSLQSLAVLQQLIGRSFRTDDVPLVVEFRDVNPMTEKHARKRLKFYEQAGANVEIVGDKEKARKKSSKAAAVDDGQEWLRSKCAAPAAPPGPGK